MTINMYDVQSREHREIAHKDFCLEKEYGSLVDEAKRKGFRHATIGEIHDSAESKQGAEEIFCWKGGLWVKL